MGGVLSWQVIYSVVTGRGQLHVQCVPSYLRSACGGSTAFEMPLASQEILKYVATLLLNGRDRIRSVV